jgi:RNA polymerase sigma-70 factor (ECF subfamily)
MTQQTAIADAELLLAYARERSADAFASLVNRYAGMVHGVGLRITGSREDAQDVVQECFLQLAAQAAQITQPLPAWLHTLARGRAIDMVRRRATRERHERQSMRPEAVPLSLEQWDTLCQHVDAAIEALPDELRIPLIGQYLQGRTQQDLAHTGGVNQATISRRIERAVEQLREHLKRSGADVPEAAIGAALAELVGQSTLPAELMGKLTKIGLSGTGAASAVKSISPAWVAAGAVTLLVLSGGAIWWMQASGRPQGLVQNTNTGATAMAASTAPGTAASSPLRRENGKVWIDGLLPGQRDTNPYAQGLSILFRQLGRKDADYIRVMGYSGIAFSLQMDLSGPIDQEGSYDVAWWPNDSYAFNLRYEFLGQAFGRELRWIRCDIPEYNAAPAKAYQTRFEPAIIDAINQGFPVLAQQDAAVLATGYDTASHTPVLLWPSPGQPVFGPANNGIPWGIYVPGRALTALSPDAAELQSLRWAIALWDEAAAATAKGWDASQILTGSKAYATWLDLLQQQKDGVGRGRRSWDNNLMIHLRYNRAAAVAYLRDLAARRSGAVADHLSAAASLYQQVLDEANRAPLPTDFRNSPSLLPQKLQEYTDSVRRISQLEAQAINEIRQALATAGT